MNIEKILPGQGFRPPLPSGWITRKEVIELGISGHRMRRLLAVKAIRTLVRGQRYAAGYSAEDCKKALEEIRRQENERKTRK